jgi:hypothetical protein
VWRITGRLRRLDDDRGEGQATMTRRPGRFKIVPMAAGEPGRPVPAVPVPPSLRAAACDLRGRDVVARFDVGGAEVVAAVSGPGDPVQWWSAIWDMVWPPAAPRRGDSTLPPGLSALAWRDLDDELNLHVSAALPPARQRSAARKAMRASCGRGWRRLLPVPLAALRSATGRAPGRAPGRGRSRQASAPRTHLASWVTLSAVLAAGAAAAFLTVTPQHHHRPAPRAAAASRTRSAVPVAQHGASHNAGSRAAARPPKASPRAVTGGVPPGHAAPPSASPSPGGGRTPSARPTPGSQPTSTPGASPSPSPTAAQCVVVLGVRICLR